MSANKFLKQQGVQQQQQYSDSGDKDKKPEREAFILTRSYELLNEDGRFSESDKKTLEKVDALLKEANIQINTDAMYALTVDNKGNKFAQRGASGGFIDRKVTPEDQAGILEVVYTGYVGDDHKFTIKEQEILSQIDNLLPDASITINSETGDATVSWNTDHGVRSEVRNFEGAGGKVKGGGKGRK